MPEQLKTFFSSSLFDGLPVMWPGPGRHAVDVMINGHAFHVLARK